MSLNADIIAAVTPIVQICEPDYYGGESETYCTFGYTEIPANAGDNVPQAYRCLVGLHLFLPRGDNSVSIRRDIRDAIIANDSWTAPTITNASDNSGQHFIFEFETIGDL